MKSKAYQEAKAWISKRSAAKRSKILKKSRSQKLRAGNKLALKNQGEDFTEVLPWTGERDLV